MTEETHDDHETEEDPPEGGGSAPAQSTPPLKEQGVPGQTQVDAPDDDVGGQRGGEDRTD